MFPPPHRGHCLLRAAPAVALTLAVALFGCPPAAAGPTERLRDFFAAVNAVLADPATENKPLERIARIRPLVAEMSDVNEAAAVALGREWQARSPVERDEFVTLFAELLERAYVGRLAGTASVSDGVRIVYRGEAIADDEATVQTALGTRDGGRALVEYRMTHRQGRWRVRDLVLDGVSTVENYRAQFRRLLGQMSYEDVVGQVRAKLNEASVMFARVGGRTASAPVPPSTELVQLVRLEVGATEGGHQPPVVPAAATGRSAQERSAQDGWSIGAATMTSSLAGRAGSALARSAVAAAWYWVQAGAFRTATAAGRLVERLGGGTVVSTASGRLLLVRVGPFAEHAQAVSKLRELEALGHHPSIAEARY